jgi:hypothetical protein
MTNRTGYSLVLAVAVYLEKDSVKDSVRDSVRDSVKDSVKDLARDSVRGWVRNSEQTYCRTAVY